MEKVFLYLFLSLEIDENKHVKVRYKVLSALKSFAYPPPNDDALFAYGEEYNVSHWPLDISYSTNQRKVYFVYTHITIHSQNI